MLEMPSADGAKRSSCGGAGSEDIPVEKLVELFPELAKGGEQARDGGIPFASLAELRNGKFRQLQRENNGLDPEAVKALRKRRVTFGGGNIRMFFVNSWESYEMHGKRPRFHPVPRR